jgi:hypothetical protein
VENIIAIQWQTFCRSTIIRSLTVCSVFASGMLAGCSRDVSAPPYGVNSSAAENYPSDLSAVIRFNYKTLASTMEQALTKQMRGNSITLTDCVPAQSPLCNGVTGALTVNRTAPLQVNKASQAGWFDVTVPVAISGEINSPALPAPVKVGDLQATLKTTVSADIGPDWCPTLQLKNDYTLNQPGQVELATGVNVHLTAQQIGPLNELNDALSALLQRQINCTEIRAQAEKIWATRSVPVDVPTLGTMHLNVSPERIQLNESLVQDQALDFSFVLGGQVKLDTIAQPKQQQQSLPSLGRTNAPADSQLKVQMPVTLNYAVISDEIKRLITQNSKNGQLAVSTDVGTANITFGQVRSYPSYSDLAIAIQFKADMPSILPSTNGSVYVLVTPVLDADGKTLRMTNLRSSTSLSNDLYQSLDLELSKSVRKRVEKYLTFEVGTSTEQLTQVLNEELAKQQEGLRFQVEIEDADIKLSKANLREEGLVVVTQFSTVPKATSPTAARSSKAYSRN